MSLLKLKEFLDDNNHLGPVWIGVLDDAITDLNTAIWPILVNDKLEYTTIPPSCRKDNGRAEGE